MFCRLNFTEYTALFNEAEMTEEVKSVLPTTKINRGYNIPNYTLSVKFCLKTEVFAFVCLLRLYSRRYVSVKTNTRKSLNTISSIHGILKDLLNR